jgi:hypothetical protein
MSNSPLPPTLESLGKRPFCFYPTVVNVQHNEWVFERATWSELLVINTKTSQEVWVPRRFLGEVSKVDEPRPIVGLKRELEYKAGSLWPYERRVLEMPKAVSDYTQPTVAESSTPVPAGVRLAVRKNDGAESNIGKLIIGVLVLGMVVTFAVVSYFRGRTDPKNVQYVGIVQQNLGLTGQDDYHTVKRKLGGPPKEDRWRPGQGELQYRVMHYPEKGIYVILMGQEQEKARYIGSLDENWKPVDVVNLPAGGSTRSMLNKLARF